MRDEAFLMEETNMRTFVLLIFWLQVAHMIIQFLNGVINKSVVSFIEFVLAGILGVYAAWVLWAI